jgi:DNA-binding transcriptional regulator YhcF (GntR family)
MEFNNNQAIYIQIADYICEYILLKKWKEGERLPSVREIAVELQVNPNTVMRTYNFLQEKEIIFNKRGIGYFISGNGYLKTLEYKKELFLNKELPEFFKNIRLLNIDINEIIEQYKRNHY